jgi:DNA polymerase I-like protein with 3'-5' exonuclease and polymerase domains
MNLNSGFQVIDKQPFKSAYISRVSKGGKVKPIVLLMDSPNIKSQVISDDAFATFKSVVEYTLASLENQNQLPDEFALVIAAVDPQSSVSLSYSALTLLKSLDPSMVILTGSRVSQALLGENYRDHFGVTSKMKLTAVNAKDEIKLKVPCMFSLPVWGWTDPKPTVKGDNSGGFVALIGFVYRHLCTAISGNNPYLIPMDAISTKDAVFVDTMEKFDKFFDKLMAAKIISIDTETASLNRVVNTLLTVQFTFADKSLECGYQSYFIPMFHRQTPFSTKELAKIVKRLRWYFEFGESKYTVYQNAKFDLVQFYGQLGVRWYNHRVYDVSAGCFSLDENRKFLKQIGLKPYALDTIEREYGLNIPDRAKDKEMRTNMAAQPLDKIFEYGLIDTISPFLISRMQIRQARDRGYEKWLTLVVDQIGVMMLSISRMEYTGIAVDAAYLQSMMLEDSVINKALTSAKNKFESFESVQKANDVILKQRGWKEGHSMFEESKKPFVVDIDINEHKQLLFFNTLALEPVDFGSGGVPSIDKMFQKTYDHVPEVAMFTEYSSAKTIKATFIDALFYRLLEDEDAIKDGRIRASFDFKGVLTGRSCFTAETPITMADGSKKPISEVMRDDRVWSYNTKIGKFQVNRVKRSWRVGDRSVCRVHFDDRTVDCTPDHRFYTMSGWVEAQYLVPKSDMVVRFNVADSNAESDLDIVTYATVKAVVPDPLGESRVPVYDLEIDNVSNFIANGLLVHNSSFKPNFQNMPSRGKLAKITKRIFKPAAGKMVVKSDYSAHEVRMLGVASNDKEIASVFAIAEEAIREFRLAKAEDVPALTPNFKRNSDIHIINVKILFNLDIDKNHPLRSGVKAVVFATVYGSGIPSIAAAIAMGACGEAKKLLKSGKIAVKAIKTQLKILK